MECLYLYYEDERLSIEINGSPFNRPSKLSQLVKLPVHFLGHERYQDAAVHSLKATGAE